MYKFLCSGKRKMLYCVRCMPAFTTLKVESFAGRKFRDFAIFFVDRESLYPRNRTFMKVREILLKKPPKMALK